jgi:catalase
MPLSTDEKILTLGQEVLKQLDTIFGYHPGFRPAHAKGIMLSGTFTPSPESTSL